MRIAIPALVGSPLSSEIVSRSGQICTVAALDKTLDLDHSWRSFTEEIGDLKRLLSTSQILKEWSEKARMNTADVKQVLTDVSRRGRFFPNSGDTHFDW